MDDLLPTYLQSTLAEFECYQTLAERSLAQLSEAEWFFVPDPESNSIALVVKHVAGNLRSRWSGFLHSDGEKADRNRDSEFVLEAGDTVESLKARWEGAWKILFEQLRSLEPADLSRTITIRSEPILVVAAIQRSLAHTAHHVGQIVYLAKHLRGSEFGSLSVPKGQSEVFWQGMKEKFGKS
jgi:hypothetical protein